MKLDEQARARLRALSESARVPLDDGARSRIVRRVVEEGPRALRRGRVERAARWAAGAALAACAVGYFAYGAGVRAPQPVARPEAPRAPAQPAAVATARACATRALPLPRWSAAASEAARIELGEAATVIAQAGSSAWVDASDPCRIGVRLQNGRVVVDAADLAGGELSVLTPGGDVLVHGTRFAVGLARGVLTVEVTEGRVAVRPRSGAPSVLVAAGQQLRVTADLPGDLEALGDEARAAIDAAFEHSDTAPAGHAGATRAARAEAERAARAAAPSASDLLAEADALWRGGDRERARARYKQAGAQGGATAEAAWLALARRELSAGEPAAAIAAIAAYEARFARGQLAGEAAGIAFRAALQQGDAAHARRRAEWLTRNHPHTPQAEAAQRWLRAHPAAEPR